MTRFAAALLIAAVASSGPRLQAQPAAPATVFTAADLMATVKTLTGPEMQGRQTGTAGNVAARAFIKRELAALKLEPLGKDFELPFEFERRMPDSTTSKQAGVNLAGLCRGTGPPNAPLVVVSAHYDHLGVRNGETYHGADDNASGTSALLALARQCRQTPFRHDVVFAAFDAEEMGLRGARAFVASPPVPPARIAINVNLDMVARGDKNELYIAGTHHTPSLRPLLEPIAARQPIKVLFGHDSGGGQNDWTTQSDHGAFHAAKIPFLYFGVEDHPDYHKPTDTADKINPQFLFAATRTVLDALGVVDRALPLAK